MSIFLAEKFSFKDNVARVVKNNGKYYRYIFTDYGKEFDHLLNSGLYDELINLNLLIPHKEVKLEFEIKIIGLYKVILPEQLSFISLPFEWTYGQWRKVILSFIEINLIALKYGMILKDATPYNFYLNRGNAILFDTSSFTFFHEPNYWISYKQFCEEMLGPFALMHYKGNKWGRLTQASHRGLPLDFLSKNLPFKSYFNINLLIHIHLNSKYYYKSQSRKTNTKDGFSKLKLIELFNLMKTTVSSWESCHIYKNHWFNYYENDIETNEYLIDKENTIKSILEYYKPKSVLDLGANTGKFSKIASNYTERVIALENDEKCVEEIENYVLTNKIENIFTLVGDLTESSPDFGLLNEEHESIFKRANSELVMALALVHHLAIPKQLPFQFISQLLFNFTSKFVIIEFIDQLDRKVIQLLKDNPRYYPTQNEFEIIIQVDFKIITQKSLELSKRTLYLLEKKLK